MPRRIEYGDSGRQDSEDVEISCEIITETSKALLIDDGTKKVWVPKSQTICEVGYIVIPEWLAKAKGLI